MHVANFVEILSCIFYILRVVSMEMLIEEA